MKKTGQLLNLQRAIIPLAALLVINTAIATCANDDKPIPRFGHGMAYDVSRDRVVMFGGVDIVDDKWAWLGDTWEWDGEKWLHIDISSPAPRGFMAMAYDASRHVIVLAGGRTSDGPSSETWEYDGSSWKLVVEDGPFMRDHFNMVYNPIDKVVLSYGGYDGRSAQGDLWQWDGRQWTLLSSSGPPERVVFAMTWDHQRNSLLIHGGTTISGARLADMWEWDGRTWKLLGGPYSNRNINHFALVHDEARNMIIYYGGLDRSWLPSNLIKKLVGEKFQIIETEVAPPARVNHAMVYVNSREEVFLFGGDYESSEEMTLFNDSWVWNGKSWRQVD